MAQSTTRRRLWCALGATLMVLLAGCPSGTGEGLDSNGRPVDEGDGTPPVAPGPNFKALQDNVLTPVCTVCHAGAAAPVGLKLDAANAYDMLVGVASEQVPALLRVSPGDPDNSYLIQKIEGTAAVGQQMPLGGPFLDSDTVALVRAWIRDGAAPPADPPPDTPPTVVSLTPVAGAVLSSVPTQITAVMSKEMDASLVSDLTVTLTASGGDGTFGDALDLPIVPVAVALAPGDADTIVMDLAGIALVDDDYQVRLIGQGATALADLGGVLLDGNADGTAGDDFTAVFTVATAAPPPEATWRSLQDAVFTPRCVVCHVAGGQASFLLLDEPNSYASLVGVPSIEVASLLRVEPLNADDSYLVQKLEGTASVGAQMPLGSDPLPAATIAAVRNWIDAGAVMMPGDPVPDVIPPAVVVAAPLGVLSGTVTLAANASDASGVAGVDFLIDGVVLSTDTVAPFEATWDTTTATDGDHEVTAVALDSAGNSATSDVVIVAVDNAPPPDVQPPAVTLNNPGATLSGTIELGASATDNVGVTVVHFYVDDQLLGSDNSAPYTQTLDTTSLSDGAHTLRVEAEDAAGNIASSPTLSVTVDNAPPPDTTAPLVSLTAPASPISGLVVLAVTATDDVGVTAVRVFVDNVLLGSDTIAPYQFDLDSTLLADGSYTLRAEADDAAGNTGVSADQVVTIDNTGPGDVVAPTVSLSAPDDPLTGTVTVSVLASDDVGVVLVTLLVDGAPAATDIDPPYDFTLDTTALADGVHTLQASARDAAANVGESALLSVTVDNADRERPSIELVAPVSPVAGTVELQTVVDDNVGVTSVTIAVDGAAIATLTSAPFSASWDTSALTDGPHVISATASDAAGNEAAAAPLVVTVTNGGAQPTLAWIQAEIFDLNCTSGCHVAGGIAPFLLLDEANAFGDLVNVDATQGGSIRVIPGDADDSVLIERLEGTRTPGMPLGSPPLPQSDIDVVRQWIDSGALEFPADVIAPAVVLIPPAATLSGVVTLQALAVDDVGVIRVDFTVDGNVVGSGATTPYQFDVDTSTIANGPHTISARAVDAAGNVGDALDIEVTINNAAFAANRQQRESN